MKIELACCEMVLMNEISQPETTLEGIAKTMAMAWVSSEMANGLVDWKRISAAVYGRWGKEGGDRLQGMVRDLLGQKSRESAERN